MTLAPSSGSNCATAFKVRWGSEAHFCYWRQLPHCHQTKLGAYHNLTKNTDFSEVQVRVRLNTCLLFKDSHNKQQYLPPTLQEVTNIVVSFWYQMERLPNDLLLHVLCLQKNMWHCILTGNKTRKCGLFGSYIYRAGTLNLDRAVNVAQETWGTLNFNKLNSAFHAFWNSYFVLQEQKQTGLNFYP